MHHQLKVTLRDIKPPIWRRVVVPSDFSLYGLHVVLQVAMGWEECHLHDFRIGKQLYESPGPDGELDGMDESDVALRDVAPRRAKILYQYDFGDSWLHDIVVEKIIQEDDDPVPKCIGGARAAPPEDSGGPWGYKEKLKVLVDPGDKEAKELREWIGEDFNPERFDMDAINEELREIFQPKPRPRRKKRAKKK